MEEIVITFETAKLAREKNFPQHVRGNRWYSKDGTLTDRAFGVFFSAPSQAMIQKWLRDKHKLDVYVEPYNKDGYLRWSSCIRSISRTTNGVFLPMLQFLYVDDTYEDALEVGIKKALNLIV